MTRYGTPCDHFLPPFYFKSKLNVLRSYAVGKLSFGHTSQHGKQGAHIKSQRAISERSNARFTGLLFLQHTFVCEAMLFLTQAQLLVTVVRIFYVMILNSIFSMVVLF